MKQDNVAWSQNPGTQMRSARKSVIAIVGLTGMIMAGLAWYFHCHTGSASDDGKSSPTASAEPVSNDTEDSTVQSSKASIGIETTKSNAEHNAMPPAPVAPKSDLVHPAATVRTRPPASAYTRTLIRNLTGIDVSRGPITPEQAAAWKEEYKKLVNAGADAVPAIAEFLDQNSNVDFSSLPNGDQLGAHSTRQVMFGALRQIGGQDATALVAEVMQTTSSPEEIAILAGDLQAMAPGEYADAALAAARNSLAKVERDPNSITTDMSPVFEVLQNLGGGNAVTDLQQAAGKWNYYAPIALASLPDGAGIASLAQMADNSDGSYNASNRMAIRLLAQLACQYPDAAQALLNQIRDKGVPDSAWVGIAAALGGEQTYYGSGFFGAPVPTNGTDPKGYHLANNNQNYLSLNVSAGWTGAQVQQQLALIDQLSAMNPTASRMLAGVRGSLAARLSR